MVNRRVSVAIDADLNGFNRGVLSGVASTKAWIRELESADSRLAAITQTGLALAPALVPIGAAVVPAIAGLTTQLGFAGVAAGTTLLAFQGVGDALDALNTYQLEPTEANLEKLNETMAALGPAGEVFVRQLQEMRDEFQGLQDVAQAEMFPGMAEGLDSLMTQMPAFERVIGSVASAIGDLAADTGAGLASDEWVEFYDYLDREAGPILEAMGHSLGNFVEGMTNMVMAFDPLSDDFTEGMLSMSEAFVEWSDNLDSSQGFQEFVRYVQESGPQVLDTFAAIASALIEFAEAAAPVGAVVLPVLEVLADTLAGIADSPVGPVLVGAAAAVGTLGRSLALLSAVGLRGGGESMIGSIFGADKIKAGAAALDVTSRATDRASMSVTAFAAAEEKRTNALKAGAAQIGKNAAAIGGLTLAASGVADGMGLSNTASMALMGTLAGPWGAAVGGAAGLTMDLRAANDGLEAAIRGVDAAIAEADLDGLILQYQRLGEEMVKQEGIVAGMNAGIPGLGSAYDMLIGKTDEAGAKSAEAAEAIVRLKNAQADAAADKSFYNSLQAETAALEENVSAMRAKRDEALRGSNAMLNYQSALLDVRDAANANSNVLGRNGQLLAGQKRAGIEAKQSLNDMAAAWNGLNDKAQNAPGAFRGAIRSFVDAAEKMGIGEERAEQMARAILEIPNKHSTTISMEVDTAVARARAIKAELASIDRNIDVYVNIRRPNAGGFGPQAVSTNAYGDVKDRHSPEIAKGGSWRVWAEDETQGESYIPHANDFRRPRARQILEETASILGARSVEWYASGGSTDKKRRRLNLGVDDTMESTTDSTVWLNGLIRATSDQVKAAAGQVDAAEIAALAAKDQHDAAQKSLAASKALYDGVASNTRGLFDIDPLARPANAWASGAGDPLASLQSIIDRTGAFSSGSAALAGRGLDGAALAYGLESEDNLAQLSAMSDADLQRFEDMFNQAQAGVTQAAMTAAGVTYGAELAQNTAIAATSEQHLAQMNAGVWALQQTVDQLTQRLDGYQQQAHDARMAAAEATGAAVGSAVNGGAAKGQRDRRNRPNRVGRSNR